MTRYDMAIIGTGPAGLSAAINAKIRNKSFIIFGTENLSNKIVVAPKIDNYLGFHGISGKELKDKFKDHIDKMGIEITYEKVNSIYAMGDYFSLMVNDKMYESTTVILASGIEFSKPIEGEKEFLGRGVGYCATCDAPLYKNKVVTIVGYNREAAIDAVYVSELASKVYYIPMHKEEFPLNDKIEVIKDVPVKVVGNVKTEKLILKNREIETDGIFFMRDSLSPDVLVPGIKAENGHILVDREMKTNIKGCYAAGDIVGRPYQYMKAAGEGEIAALNAALYLGHLMK